ncbi:MAG: enoyl-CoA hydratase-related protein, partial [Rhodospirillales bacterium]|nr:enoyl-CoA hydratase-related protein [Rhodospirillales bacterium]
IHNEASNFSVGANIAYLLVPAYLHLGFVIRFLAGLGQRSYQALKYAPFPVVGAPSGMALGGGCEVLLHCDAVQAHGETYMGLVEAAVGLIPGWGGCTEMLGRWQADKKLPGGPMPPVAKVFETVSMATVAKSAMEAKDHLFLLDRDAITMNRNRVLADAKAKALELADGYGPPERIEMNLPGASALAAMRMAIRDFRKRGIATPHDATVAEGLAGVLSGGKTDITETMDGNDILKLEREGFARLALLGKTKARIRHMLMKGKPLRN